MYLIHTIWNYEKGLIFVDGWNVFSFFFLLFIIIFSHMKTLGGALIDNTDTVIAFA